MIKEQRISFVTAKLVDKHWKDYSGSMYVGTGRHIGEIGASYDCQTYYPAPTQSLLQKWLREVHNIEVTSMSLEDGWWYYVGYIRSGESEIDSSEGLRYNLYEEALEDGLFEALKLI